MFGTVLVPLDGSELAEAALPYAKAIAEKTGAVLHLVRVVPIDAPPDEAAEAREYLSRLAGRLGDRVQLSVRYGHPAAEIIDLAQELADPIIVMTTHGRGGLGRWLYGSVADRVVRGAGVPVLLIRSGLPQRALGEVRSIMVPLDGSPLAEAALPYAVELARRFDAELHLVRVVETPEVYALLGTHAQAAASGEVLAEIAQQMIDDASNYLNELAERLRAEGVRVESHVLEGLAIEQLLAFERERQPDLVVMATHGRGGLSRVIFGSVAEHVLREGNAPVMLIRPPEPEEKG
uniref:Universal stress protein n=1 Tax=Thermorudis peleae TaxID=1382356 RepID=A0A831TAJ4_9BACT